MSTRRGSGMSAKQRAYREFVESAAAEPDDEFAESLKESPRSIGSDTFRVWVDKIYDKLAGGGNVCEDIAFRRVTEPMSADVILEAVAVALGVETSDLKMRLRSSPLRGIAARMLIRFGGMTQREAATSLNMGTGGAVGARVRRLPALLEKDRRLRRQTALLEDNLQSMRSNGAKC